MTELDIEAAGGPLRLAVAPGEPLTRAIWLSGQVEPVPLCNGLGLCGRCRCRFLEAAPGPLPREREFFTPEELAAGWRLACCHTVPATAKLRLELPLSSPAARVEIRRQPAPLAAVLGYDLGTTSIQWQAMADSGDILAQGGQCNPQAGAGADVISRLGLAMREAGLRSLANLARSAFDATLERLAAANLVIARACIAANSAMTCILLQKTLAGLAKAPYALPYAGNETIAWPLASGKTLPVYIPPLPAPFVGGDIVAGLAWLLEQNCPRPFLLLDLGTNAELALLTGDNRLVLGSAPLGPAMEGIGPQCGQAVGPGVITAFNIGPAGLEPAFFGGQGPACGIGATGYLSLLARLLALGLMDCKGKFQKPAMPLARKLAAGLSKGRFNLPQGQFLTARDVEQLLKVKAALAVALARVLAAGGLGPHDLARLYLAGALGQFANLDDLLALGFLPRALRDSTVAIGNASLLGATLLGRNPDRGQALASLCKQALIVDMANDSHFLPDYLAAMSWGPA